MLKKLICPYCGNNNLDYLKESIVVPLIYNSVKVVTSVQIACGSSSCECRTWHFRFEEYISQDDVNEQSDETPYIDAWR